MRIVISGASGLIGTALGPALRAAGHDVTRLVRGAPTEPDEIFWDPRTRILDTTRLEGVDAIVNLSGENVASRRWTAAQRERIWHSRVDATYTLVTAVTKLSRKPVVFLSASATGFYGDRGDEELTEASGIGHGFFPETCLAWETHAEGAARAGVRTALLRFGVVLAPGGGALATMLPVFRLGLGGRVGDGRQWLSWIALDDAVAAICFALSDPRCAGPVNVVAPVPVTNAEFAATLGRVLRRPAVLPVPAWMLRLVFGRLADETLLASTRVVPAKLLEAGCGFRHATLEAALRQMLGK